MIFKSVNIVHKFVEVPITKGNSLNLPSAVRIDGFFHTTKIILGYILQG